VTNTTQSNDTSHTLKSLIAQANDLLDAIRGSKQDSSSSGDGSSTGSSFSATPQVLPGATQNAQAPQPGDFLKLVHTSASSAPVPVADQVLVQIKSAGADSGSQIKIQLHPEDLGKVVVQMNTDSDGKTGISITADNRQTLALLQNEARSLENALRDIGLKTDTGGLSFNLSGQQHQQQNPNSFGGYTQVAAATTDDDADYYTAPTAIYSLGIQQGLDIRV
jgi:flagellar hook-length control protein FliK